MSTNTAPYFKQELNEFIVRPLIDELQIYSFPELTDLENN